MIIILKMGPGYDDHIKLCCKNQTLEPHWPHCAPSRHYPVGTNHFEESLRSLSPMHILFYHYYFGSLLLWKFLNGASDTWLTSLAQTMQNFWWKNMKNKQLLPTKLKSTGVGRRSSMHVKWMHWLNWIQFCIINHKCQDILLGWHREKFNRKNKKMLFNFWSDNNEVL